MTRTFFGRVPLDKIIADNKATEAQHCGTCRRAHWPTTIGLYTDIKGVCTSPVWDIMPQPKRPEIELRDGAHCPCFEPGGKEPERGKT